MGVLADMGRYDCSTVKGTVVARDQLAALELLKQTTKSHLTKAHHTEAAVVVLGPKEQLGLAERAWLDRVDQPWVPYHSARWYKQMVQRSVQLSSQSLAWEEK